MSNSLSSLGHSQASIFTRCGSEPVIANRPVYEHHWGFTDKCPKIDRTFIAERVYVSDKILHCKIVDTIEKLANSDPEIRDYINFVFTNLVGFHIGETSGLKFAHNQSPHQVGSGFTTGYRVILIDKNVALNSPDVALAHFRHEFRHAYIHCLQIILNKEKTRSTSITPPQLSSRLLTAKQNELKKNLQEGLSKIERFSNILLGKAKPTELEKKAIRELNSKLTTLDGKDYPTTYPVLYDHKHKAGETISIDLPGFFSVKGIVKSVKPLNKNLYELDVHVSSSAQDNLKRLVNHFYHLNHSTIQQYINDIDTYLFEFDAHLFGCLPPFLIKFFFPRFYEHMNQFIADARSQLQTAPHVPLYGQYFFPQINSLQNKFSLTDMNLAYELYMADAPVLDLTKETYLIVNSLYAKKEYNKIIKILEKFISRGKGKENNSFAHKMLGRVYWNLAQQRFNMKNYFSNENFDRSAKHFKIADKNKATLNSEEKRMYAESLKKIGLEKTSKKVLK